MGTVWARMRAMLRAASFALAAALSLVAAACDSDSTRVIAAFDAGGPSATIEPRALPEPPKAPDIIVDVANVSIGSDRVPAGQQGLADKVAVLLVGRPAIAGQVVDFVAMRSAKPSQVAAVVSALRRARATGVNVKTAARDDTTQKLALSFVTGVADCATVAWIAKDAAVDVWPAGGGTAKRIIKGMAGPDMTLGTEAVHKQAGGCNSPELIVGADERFSWGLVFDLAMMSLHEPGARTTAVVLVSNATPGRKIVLDAP
ncbi:MAG: hypothetical protein M3O46_04775 [Myxococcota bacterium]|nr:hypothetical protein [Myxococcota bacterium]